MIVQQALSDKEAHILDLQAKKRFIQEAKDSLGERENMVCIYGC